VSKSSYFGISPAGWVSHMCASQVVLAIVSLMFFGIRKTEDGLVVQDNSVV
jgi:hypothetical protein